MNDAMENNTVTPRSARAAALERRRALSQNGRTALGMKPSQSSPSVPISAVRSTAAVVPPQSTSGQVNSAPVALPTQIASSGSMAGASGKSLSRARREALSQGGKLALGKLKMPTVSISNSIREMPLTAETSSSGCGCKDTNNTDAVEYEQAIEDVCAIIDDEPAALGSVASAVRKLCQERRRALSSKGKSAAKISGGSATTRRNSVMSGLSGREIARIRREEMCQQGRGNEPACRPSGRVRPKPSAPIKVEAGTTLSGAAVTGTQVERNGKVTGIESGSCRTITGTEYIGMEQYTQVCATTPDPAPAKVKVGTTSRGQRVSGTEVGNSIKVTGDENGLCKSVTGTEYLGAEQFVAFCDSKPKPAPAKVSVMLTAAGQNVSGGALGRSNKVTGDETGASAKLTGSQYVQNESSSASRSGSGAPHKVSVMSTSQDRTVTGTDVATGDLVTGAERGACASITGTESNGLAQYQACNREPVSSPEKVNMMRTWNEQQVSGTALEHNSKVTGDECGSCQQISGTEYIGPDQYKAFCDPEQQAASRALMSSRGAQAGLSLRNNGNATSDIKVTGAARGESQILSGTPYSGSHQRVSQRGANNNSHPLSRSPHDAPREVAPAIQQQRVQGDFSIATPARSAQDSSLSRVTGTAYGAIGRITGPINMAAGLVSGTPEFRYQENIAPVVMIQAQAPAVEEIRSRLTGDGREGGFAITGAAWRRNESVTGTEGNSTRRNPTLRGDQRGVVIGASQMKDRDRPELPMSKITGSSGNDAKGSAITYSGGARG